MRLWSFFCRLFRRQSSSSPRAKPVAQAAPPPTSGAETDVAVRAPAADACAITPEPEFLTEEDEDDWGHDADEEDSEAEPDPFIRGTAPEIDFHSGDVGAMRAKARADALSGEHRLLLSSAAGPGSLAEALNSLVAEGRVEAEFVDDPLDGPVMIYRPIAPEARRPPSATSSPQT